MPLEKGNGMKGSILYANYAYKAGQPANGLFAWDLNSFRSVPVDLAAHPMAGGPIYTSPDGALAALTSGSDLLVMSQQRTRSFAMPLPYLKIRTYLPDGRILLDLASHLSAHYEEGRGLNSVYYLFDPMTGRFTEQSAFLPHFVPGESLWTLQYSPDVKYILYRSSPGENNVQFTLFSLEENRVLWAGPARDPSLVNVGVPAWRPDASALTAIYKDAAQKLGYYTISLDGSVSAMGGFDGVSLEGVTRSNEWRDLDMAEFADWSADGRYLASLGIGKVATKGLPSSLFLWDDQQKTLSRPCLPEEENRISGQYDLIWSYDESRVLVPVTFMPSPTPVQVTPGVLMPGYVTKVYLLDLSNKIIYAVPALDGPSYFAAYKGGYNTFLGWVNWQVP